jgi:hypothetical protein
MSTADREVMKERLLLSVNEEAREALLASVAVMQSEAVAGVEQPLAELRQRLEGVRTATGPKKRGRRSKTDWKVAQKAEITTLQSEIDELR